MSKKSKSKRKRVGRDRVRQNAKEQGSRRAFFKLPEGVAKWEPEKSGSHILDIVPYEVTDKNHPDGVEAGVLWYKRSFLVHRNIGARGEMLVCPTSINKPCPICQEKQKLAKNWDENEDQIKALSPQKFTAYNILNPEDSDSVSIFCMSRGKFALALDKELEEGEEDILNFYDVTDDGKTLKVRFSEASYEGRKYLEATRIDFRDRKAMDEDEILGKVVNLDEALVVLPYDKIKTMFLEVEDEDDEDDDSDEDDEPKKKKGKAKKEDEEDEESSEDDDSDEDADDDNGDSDEEEDDSDEDDSDEDDSDEDDSDEDDSDEDEEKPKKKKGKAKKEEVEEEDDDDSSEDEDDDDSGGEEDDDEEEEKPKKKGKKSSKKEEEEDDDDSSEDEDDSEDEEKPKKKGKKESKEKKAGKKKCPHKGGTFGKDLDKHEECDDCALWDDCEEASE